MFESYNVMKEQVEKAKEDLKIQRKELEKSKKEVISYSSVNLFSFLFSYMPVLSARI